MFVLVRLALNVALLSGIVWVDDPIPFSFLERCSTIAVYFDVPMPFLFSYECLFASFNLVFSLLYFKFLAVIKQTSTDSLVK